MAIETFRHLHETIVRDAVDRTRQELEQSGALPTPPTARPVLSGGTYTETGYTDFWRAGDAVGDNKPLKP